MIEVFQPANSNLTLNASYHVPENVDKETKMKMREDLEKLLFLLNAFTTNKYHLADGTGLGGNPGEIHS
jgi:hypothetical protein